MAVDQELVDAAIELARTCFPAQDWSGAAALRLDDGAIVTGAAPEFPNGAVRLCHETGAICEAFKRGRQVVASVGVPEAADPRRWRTLRLRDVQPHWFARVFPDDVWPFEASH
jgi:cytidine deaminase